MGIGDQFAGLDMSQLIGGPLTAVADASMLLASSTSDFINKVGFDADGKLRTAAFGYQKHSSNADGTINLDDMQVNVPMLAIVPIPNLQVDEVNILFDMEVKQSEKSDKTTDMATSVSGSANFGIVKVNITGNVSAHENNTRSTDNSAKYHVDVRATNHGTPEGLARVLDMMAANISPALIGSTVKDSNGQDLPEKARLKAERMKALNQEISKIENRLSTAKEGFMDSIQQFKRIATSQQNDFLAEVTKKLKEVEKKYDNDVSEAKKEKGEDATKKIKLAEQEHDASHAKYSEMMEEISQNWNAFQNEVTDSVRMITDSNDNTGEAKELNAVFHLKAAQTENNELKITVYANGIGKYTQMVEAQNAAVKKQININKIEDELAKKKEESSDLSAGVLE